MIGGKVRGAWYKKGYRNITSTRGKARLVRTGMGKPLNGGKRTGTSGDGEAIDKTGQSRIDLKHDGIDEVGEAANQKSEAQENVE